MTESRASGAGEIPIAIIGAGFAGIGMGIQLKERGIHSFTIFEGADRVGGTWRDNTYPGCACDVPSHVYSFSFARNPDWSRNFSPQPEILAYLERCVERWGLTRHIRFGRWIERAEWDEATARWHLFDARGERHTARVLVAGTGPLREPSIPALPGLERFEGEVMHSARWNHDYDFAGKRVAAIGTGASAIQFVPRLADEVAALHVFQRTPPWILPKLDAELPEAVRARFRRHPALTLAYRSFWYWLSEAFGTGFFVRGGAQGMRERIARRFLERSIDDPDLREKLTPDYVMGCKRVLFSNDYYPSLNRPHVELIAHGATRVTERAVVASDGTAREVDAICFGTGFAATDFLAPLELFGRGGLDLNEAWRDGAEAYYGMNVAGFPNLFILVGPNTGLGHNSIIFMIEAQVHYAIRCIERIRDRGLAWLDVKPAAQRRFNERLQARLRDEVWSAGGCTSWYLDEHGKNVALWPGYTAEYWLRTRRVDWRAYHEEPAREASRLAEAAE